MFIPKSIKCQSNLTESEIRAYFSLKPLNEDYSDHDKRFSKILNDYLETRSFKDNNARLCYKKQLKRMNKEGKTNTPKFSAFNMWRLKEIEKNISRQKTYLLKSEGKVMPVLSKQGHIVSQQNNNDELVNENNKLKLEIEKLKKQLIDKDNLIDILMNTEMKDKSSVKVEEQVPLPPAKQKTEKPKIHKITECLIVETSDEESDEEEQVPAKQKTETPKQKVSKKEAIKIFQKICIDKIPQYHEEYIKLKQGKNDIEISNIKNDIFNLTLERYDDEVIQPNVEKLDDVYHLPDEEYTQVQEKPYEKMKDMIIYFSD